MTPPAVTRQPLPTCPAECPAWQKSVGCGHLGTGLPCAHPQYREAVRMAEAEQERPASDAG